MSLIVSLPDCVGALVLSWFSDVCLANADTAISNHSLRITFLKCLNNQMFELLQTDAEHPVSMKPNYLIWVILRGIRLTCLCLGNFWEQRKNGNHTAVPNLQNLNCEGIESIIIEQSRHSTRLAAVQIVNIVNSCRKLRKLNMEWWETCSVLRNVSPEILINLTHLSLDFHTIDTSISVGHLSSCCINLKHLNLSHRHGKCNESSLVNFITTNNNLKTLYFGSTICDDKYFWVIAQSCKLLQKIEICNCCSVLFSSFSFLVKSFPNAELIKFSYAFEYSNDYLGRSVICRDDDDFSVGIITAAQLFDFFDDVVYDVNVIKLTGKNLRYNANFWARLIEPNPLLKDLELHDSHGDILDCFLQHLFLKCQFLRQLTLWQCTNLNLLSMLKTHYDRDFVFYFVESWVGEGVKVELGF
jgi:hypothetical protein